MKNKCKYCAKNHIMNDEYCSEACKKKDLSYLNGSIRFISETDYEKSLYNNDNEAVS